jgi:uncharacterized protein with ACT and thioredoxin-like domain
VVIGGEIVQAVRKMGKVERVIIKCLLKREVDSGLWTKRWMKEVRTKTRINVMSLALIHWLRVVIVEEEVQANQ